MNFGYVKVATFSPSVKVGDVEYNLSEIKKAIDQACESGVRVLVFPRLALTGSTLEDLYSHSIVTESAIYSLLDLVNYVKDKNVLVFVGMPFIKDKGVYSVSACLYNGNVLGFVPESFPNESVFCKAEEQLCYVNFNGKQVPFGKNLIFSNDKKQSFKIAVEFGGDTDGVVSPSLVHAINGARIIINHASNPTFSKSVNNINNRISALSEKAVCAYLYSNAGEGESTTDNVFSGNSLIVENGTILAEKKPFEKGINIAEIDLDTIDYCRGACFNREKKFNNENYLSIPFSMDIENDVFTRVYDKTPFINVGEEELLLDVQSEGLKKRITHVNANKVVLGLSGGLDSTLALIVAVRAIKKLNRPLKDVLAITMPCFGTSSRTLDNSIKLAKAFGVSLKKVEITKSVKRHLKDIGHPETVHDAAYENAQARERTQVLMDIANMCNGLVVGTGDLSELALGWATYNGDHMSMYAVNGSIPKTLVRHLVLHVAESGRGKLKSVLLDILDTPVSPELIPSSDGTIKQVTEDIVGPYVLHDYYLYSMIKRGFSPQKIYYTAVNTFRGEFDNQTILKWLKTFIRRFFNQQFKRSCMPDGVKATEISLSPRCGYKMPSDAVSKIWLNQLGQL